MSESDPVGVILVMLDALTTARPYLAEIAAENPDRSEFVVSEAIADLAKIDRAIGLVSMPWPLGPARTPIARTK